MGTDYYFYNEDISSEGLQSVIRCARHRFQQGRQSRAVLFLVTDGGDPNAGYQLARFFQRQYEQFDVAIPFRCKSAGTLIACGAHSLFFTETGELGPLDMQLSRQDEIAGLHSSLLASKGLLDIQSKAFLTFEKYMLDIITRSGGRLATKTAADIASRLTEGLYRPIMEQFDPMRVGEHARSTEVADAYGERLQSKYENLGADALYRLIYAYPSHGFVIDIEEAASLFNRVHEFEPEHYEMLNQAVRTQDANGQVFFVGEKNDEDQANENSPMQESTSIDSGAVEGETTSRCDHKSANLRTVPSKKRSKERPT